MTSPFQRPFVSHALIGRADELATLVAAVDPTRHGQGGLLLLAGEAGVGKTRLVTELLTSPAAEECRAIRVACLESDLTEPYALTLEIARATGDAPVIDIAPGVIAADRRIRRAQHALEAALFPDGRPRPLILVAEDIHWSDSPSLSVLLGLAQQPRHLLLVATYRSESRSPELSGFLAGARRLPAAREVRLRRLGRADVARMTQDILGVDSPIAGDLLDEIISATDGLPYLIEEAIRSWVESGAIERDGLTWRRRAGALLHAPDTLRLAIDARLLWQPAEVVQVAERAAVAGQIVSTDFLQMLCDLDADRLMAALRALSEAQILVQHRDGKLGFRHALTRQAVLSRLFEAERRALHRHVTEILESEAHPPVAALAYHWAQAGEPARAAPFALQAAERAAALHAHREAIRYYELALAGEAGARVDLLAALADQHAALGELERAISLYEEARGIHVARDEHDRAARLELRMGIAFGNDRERGAALEHLERAFTALPPEDPERWAAGLRYAVQLAAVGRHDAAESTLEDMSRSYSGPDQRIRLRIDYELGGLRALRGNWDELAIAARAVHHEIAAGDDDALGFHEDAHAALGTLAYYRGAFEDSAEHFTACIRIAKLRGATTGEAIGRWNLATNALYNLGRWDEARAEIAELQALGLTTLAESGRWFDLWLNGRWETALDAWLEGWPVMVEQGDIEVQTAHGRRIADILLALGRPRQALELLDDVLRRIRDLGARSFELQLAPREAEALARLNDPRALGVCEGSLEIARELGAQPAEALLLRARALAHRSAGAWHEAFADCDAAIALLEGLPMPYESARTQRDAGMLRLARRRRGDRERAAHYLRSAQQRFADLGATRDEASTTGLLSAAGLATASDRAPGPLTAREREVAGLVAEGLSNRSIAERLFITEKTAAYHVGSILTKLDFESRAQIAAYVVKEGRE